VLELKTLLPEAAGVDQLGIVVRDLDAALERYYDLMPSLGEWRCYTYSSETVAQLTYRGSEEAYAMKLALASRSPQIELIEPISGPNIYREWLDEHGEGPHHVGVYVDSLGDACKRFQLSGLEPIQTGHGFGADREGGGYAYFDTREIVGVIVELIELPLRRRLPERVFPN
jgi:methylmalonyl-CoA/ethylmalonyl-CoA epimerase